MPRAVIFGALVALVACGNAGDQGTNTISASSSSATASTGSGAGGSGEIECDLTPPGPLPGWEREFDGITCAHPPVEADCQDGWCRIPPGCFIKGSPIDEPGHPARSEDQRAVVLTRGFLMKQHEVTQAEWSALVPINPSGPFAGEPGGDCAEPSCPVGWVNWWEAVAFSNLFSEARSPPLPPCYQLSGCTGTLGEGMTCEGAAPTAATVYDCEGYRLPTDAEWEYAIRAGTTTAFYFGPFGGAALSGMEQCEPQEPLDCHTWYCGNSGRSTHAVGLRRPNAWHLYDMAGNAFEWAYDRYTGAAPPAGPLTDPEGPQESGTRRRRRGGSMISKPVLLRSAAGLGDVAYYRSAGFGLRLVRTIPAAPERAREGP